MQRLRRLSVFVQVLRLNQTSLPCQEGDGKRPEMRHFLVLVPYLLYAFRTVLSVNVSPEYHERLHLQPLPASSLLASFNFRSTEPSSAFEAQNYRLFPRSLAQILQHASTRELHLRFTLGRWDAESWGARPWNGAKEGGTGVELWAWVNADDDEQ